MREIEYLETIKKTLADSSLLGDDCAFLPSETLGNKGLYVTHDTLVEDVHFLLAEMTPYQLGQKAAAVNLSDIAAAGAKPLYLTISLSLPDGGDISFVEEFYKGVNSLCKENNIKVAGGDITGSEKVFVSVCAIGKKEFDVEVSRSFAKEDDVVFVTGNHGDSGGGLQILLRHEKNSQDFLKNNLIKKHLTPEAQLEKSRILMTKANENFAMMDSSDGLGDALYKLASESKVSLSIDFGKIPVSEELKKTFPQEWQRLVLWGGEDFELVGCINKATFDKLDKDKFFEIGRVVKNTSESKVILKYNEQDSVIDKNSFERNSFKHFKEVENEE